MVQCGEKTTFVANKLLNTNDFSHNYIIAAFISKGIVSQLLDHC